MKKKYTKSSEKGYVGVFYPLYIRALKSADQRNRLKKNLKSIEGLQRLLKNKDPRYWFVAMGEMSSYQADSRWIGFNRILGHKDNPNTKLIKAFQHRSIHALKLNNRYYLADKLFVVDYCIHLCSLYHPKFLKDYLDFYYSLEELVESATLYNHSENHVIFKGVKYDQIHYTILNILEIIKNCIIEWDYQYPQPQYLQDFFAYAQKKVNFYMLFWETEKFKDNIAKVTYTLRYIGYHNKKSNLFLADLAENDKKMAKISIENIENDFEELSKILWNKEEQNDEKKDKDLIKNLKNSIYFALKELNDILVHFDYAHDFEQEICVNFYSKYQKKFDDFYILVQKITNYQYNDIYKTKISEYWDIYRILKDYLLHDIMQCLGSNIYCINWFSNKLEKQKAKKKELFEKFNKFRISTHNFFNTNPSKYIVPRKK